MNLFSKNGLENPASFEEREISFEESGVLRKIGVIQAVTFA